ncbi:MAG: hypothetical protein MUP47_02365 [Phycisphaerae bacterium]|nr:hypothetical protein [Phycisphaerae bacterium]
MYVSAPLGPAAEVAAVEAAAALDAVVAAEADGAKPTQQPATADNAFDFTKAI